ncbi:hypothetical protein SAMN05518871_11357 [Psychrobacillus sp. OK028]|uniref:hypothetical protein n=1 Tax=Psychrobacillus sp. OK028 TaxID=1884359 RepID=UPI000889EB1B|nr:hypothetical protein [Psychrobacillus sp. OK028]SDO25692.1 hypothetical protein SAMN05518871_11357 [Psychrobacillus sp. OK028]
MIKWNIFIISILVFATILGMFTQELFYYTTDVLEYSFTFGKYAVILATVFSWLLYIVAPLLAYFFAKKGRIKKSHFWVYLILTVIVGSLVSLWSLFVLGMSGF